jgi:hypothetical protein
MGSEIVPDGNGVPVTLRDGRQVLVRPVRPGDGDALAEALVRGWARSKPQRFGAAPRAGGAKNHRDIIDSVDGIDHVAFAAFDDAGRLVGVARILRYPDDPDTLDVGMVIADDYQDAGLGHVLGDLLVTHRPRPATRILTSVAADNARVISLFRAFGVTPTWSDAGMVIELPG